MTQLQLFNLHEYAPRAIALHAKNSISIHEHPAVTDYSTSGLRKSPPVSEVTSQFANHMLDQYHYLGKVTGTIKCLGHAEGVLVFTNLRSRNLELKLRSVCNPIELARMVGVPNHSWSMSSLMAQGCKIIKKYGYDVIITYADSVMKHNGMVYKAAGWEKCGRAAKDGHPDIIIDGMVYSPRGLYNRVGTSSVPALRKIYGDRIEFRPKTTKPRFVKILNKKLYHDIMKLLQSLISSQKELLPYDRRSTDHHQYRYIPHELSIRAGETSIRDRSSA